MKKFALLLMVLFMFACASNDKKTYTVQYSIQAVSQHNDTTIINRVLKLHERTVWLKLHQGDLILYTMATRVSGETEVLMSGVKYFEVIKADTIKIQ
jgi:hypothetical protein